MDSIVDAAIDLPEDARMTDSLNATTTVTLHDVHVYALDDGREVVADQVKFDLAELYAVEVKDQQQAPVRHIHTRAVLVEVHSGPYRLTGHIHGPTAGDPVDAVTRRPRMVPLTEAMIEYVFAGRTVRADSAVVIFNRDLANAVRRASDHRGT